MKTPLLLLVLSLPALLLAQNPAVPQPAQGPIPSQRRVLAAQGVPQTNHETLPDNYQVTLFLKDKDGATTEMAIVTASSRFTVAIGEQRLNFQGVLSLEDDGTALVNYSLGWESSVPMGNNNIQFISSSIQGVVRTRPGAEPETIFRSDTRTAALSVVKLAVPKAR